MKKLFIIFLLMIMQISYAANCDYVCTQEKASDTTSIFSKMTGVSFIVKKLVEKAITTELYSELSSKISADIDLVGIKKLTQGEFKNLSLKGKKLEYDALSISDFSASSICELNKIIYSNKRIYFPQELPFNFSATINNDNLQHILSSDLFKKQLENAYLKVAGIKAITLQDVQAEIKDGYISFNMPFKTILSDKITNLKFNANVGVENNKIILKNITFNSKSNIMNNNGLLPLINKINPLGFEIKKTGTKFCKLNVKNAEIVGDKINIKGLFIINKNYGG